MSEKETIKQQKERKKLWYSLGWKETESKNRDYQWICQDCSSPRFISLCDACGRCEWCSGACKATFLVE